MERRLLGEFLLDNGHISDDQLHIVLLQQKKTGLRLGELLVEHGFLSRTQLNYALSAQNGMEAIDLDGLIPDQNALRFIDESFARRYSVLPVGFRDNCLRIAVADSENLFLFDRIENLLSSEEVEWRVFLADSLALQHAIDRYYGYELSIEGILQELEKASFDGATIDERIQHPLVRLLDSFLIDAVKRGASDIHFEPERHYLRIRYRIDGVLEQVRLLHKLHWSALSVRIKVLCDLDISEQRQPQDGSFTLNIAGYMTDFRVSILPAHWGENVVIRVLNRERGIQSLDSLELPAPLLVQLKTILRQPSGIILVNGPTGSGKTTTLYAILNELNREEVNIMTLEDPVEYLLPGIRQTSVNDLMGFAQGLRAILRQDPDIILIGEIRDQETAQMAFRAAMTGHKVLATLHSNDAISCLQRLSDLGVSDAWIAENLHALIAQRLVRRLCHKCKVQDVKDLEMLPVTIPNGYRPVGCDACQSSGYKGRLLLWESVVFSEALKHLLNQGASKNDLLEQAIQEGATLLRNSAEIWLRKGETSLEEIQRVLVFTDA
ncbi:ATPase, T2SS/T4P/T4SS family [Thiomicrorhabdus sp.]|uniref:GspE/PulE family protein n=1 Tax=Thiomicrorhabdus sp. TaxID=2039724 RepID=UPI0029C73846|nr:ATPase, T2SS/T4P/T4SS family [Thiomicrorhabdus sp.]